MHKTKSLALICTSLNELGGKNNHLKNIYLSFKAKGWRVHIICSSKIEEELKEFMFRAGVLQEDLILLSRVKKRFVLPFIAELSGVIKRNKYDIVHLFQIQSDVLGAFAAKSAGTKNILSYYESKFIEENISFLKIGFYAFVNALVAPWIKKTVVVSNGLKKEIAQKKYRHEKTIEVIHLGINVPREMGPLIINAQRLSEQKPVIGTIARFSHEKSLDRFISTMPLIVKEFPQAKFVLVGKGPLESDLKNLAAASGVGDKIEWKAWTNDIYAELARMDIFVMPSFREGCPTALLEALAAKRAVVASDIDGIRDIIESSENGMLADTANPDIFAGVVLSLCRHPQEVVRLGTNGFERVKRDFTMQKEMDTLEKLYLSFLQ